MNYLEKAKELHKNNIVVDAHLDLALEIFNRVELGEKDIIKNHYLNIFKEAGLNIIVTSIFIENTYLPEMGLRIALDQISMLINDLKTVSDQIILIKTKDDLNQVLTTDKIGMIISFEGLEPIMNDIHLIDIFYELGVRGAGLVWSRRNYVADGSSFTTTEQGQKGGLTNFGVKVVKKLEDLGMFIDVSHLNDEGTEDVLKLASKPIIASHSNARSVNNIMRNLSDRHIKDIGKTGGVIGINGIIPIIGVEDDQNAIMRMCDHIDHMKALVGCEHIGFGFDLCRGVDETCIRYGNQENEILDGLKNHAESIKITEELLRRGYSEDDIVKILGSNFLRILEKSLK